MVLVPKICPVCKIKHNPINVKKCPLFSKFMTPKLGESFSGPSPSIFVGRIGYPRVNVGPLGMVEDAQYVEDPRQWFGKPYEDVIALRSVLIRAKYKQNIFSKSKFVGENQELALAEKPTDVEMLFKKKPFYEPSFSIITQPMGPSATLEKLRIIENTKIDRKVEYIVSDDLKAQEAGVRLYDYVDVYKIATILSSGVLGFDRKLVPTRWSITAVDDMIAKNLIEKLRDYPSVNKFLVFESEYLDNHFVILLSPGSWEYENFETWVPGSYWSFQLKHAEIIEEYESFRGRTKYADKEAGGYYAARLGVVEGLSRLKRQARVVVFREVGDNYTIPLGVWVVRETVRNAFSKKVYSFDSLEEAFNYIKTKLKINLNEYVKRSRILSQRRLDDFNIQPLLESV